MKEWLGVFVRVNNRKKTHRPDDLINAGYFMEHCETHKWKELHDLCKATFRDGRGRSTYIWFGSQFFFLTKEDALAFRALHYLV